MKALHFPNMATLTRAQIITFVLSVAISAVVMSILTSIWPATSLILLLVCLFIVFVGESPIPEHFVRTRVAYIGFAVGWVLAGLREVFFGAGAQYLT